MAEIALSTRNVTIYTVGDYETTDYDKASRMLALVSAGVVAAECVDCKAVIPVSLVDMDDSQNLCPATASEHLHGHRVSNEDYHRWQIAVARG